MASGRADPRDRVQVAFPAEVIVREAPRTSDCAVHWKYREFLRQEVPATEIYAFHEVRFWSDNAGAIIGRDDRVLEDLTRDVWGITRHRIFTSWRLPACRRLEGVVAILSVAEGDKNYSHWMIEVLPRLDVLRRGGFPVESIDWFVVNHRGRDYELETLDALGVRREKIVQANSNVHLECARLVTTSLKIHHYAVTTAVCGFHHAWAARCKSDARPHRRIYVSPRRATFRRVLNEEEVLTLLRPRGFQVVECEALNVAGQQRLFREAAVVVAQHGSGLANVVYCQQGTKLPELFCAGLRGPGLLVSRARD